VSDFSSLAALVEHIGPPLPRRTLHCHPSVTAALIAASPPREPEPPDFMTLGCIGSPTGIEVYEDDEMMPGAWEIRECAAVKDGKMTGGTVVCFGVLGPPGGSFLRDEHGDVFADPLSAGSTT
jgi:hypothetical protein